MQTTFNLSKKEMTTAEQLAAAVESVTDPAELELIRCTMGPVDERNRPLVSALLTLLDAAGSLAAAIADNAVESNVRISSRTLRAVNLALAGISGPMEISTTLALSALPPGHRLPTNLDAHK